MLEPDRFTDASHRIAVRGMVAGAAAGVAAGLLVGVVAGIVAGAWWLGLVVAVLLAAVKVLGWRSLVARAPARVLAQLPPADGDADPADLARFGNALDGMSLQTGVERPEVRVIAASSANALCVADADSAVVVVTEGLLAGARPVELEVLAAELLCRVRDGSARYLTLVAGLPGWATAAAGTAPAEVAAVLGDQRGTRADLEAVGVTRYPPGLVSALTRMKELGTDVPGADPRLAALWLAPVGNSSDAAAHVQTATQTVDHRIAVLQQL